MFPGPHGIQTGTGAHSASIHGVLGSVVLGVKCKVKLIANFHLVLS
jgi:hypothetical protein